MAGQVNQNATYRELYLFSEFSSILGHAPEELSYAPGAESNPIAVAFKVNVNNLLSSNGVEHNKCGAPCILCSNGVRFTDT